MEIDWRLLLPLLGTVVLALLLTGPGMWSDKWGWWWLDKRAGRRGRRE